MVRLIKRYESRKLYDTEESRYVSLEEIAGWIRAGQEIQVVDNGSSDDVTTATLTQLILEEGRSGRSALPSDLLHELVRFGERALSTGVETVQGSVDRIVTASIDRLGPVRKAREEMLRLRSRLEELERSLTDFEGAASTDEPAAETAKPKPRKTARKKTTRKKATRKKAASKSA